MNIYPLNNSKTEWLLNLNGDIDLETYQRLEQGDLDPLCQEVLQAGAKKITIDLATAKRLDSVGLQLLLLIHKKCTGTQIILRNPVASVNRVLQILQFDRIFTIEQ